MQASMLSVAVVIALVLVWISPDARGATTTLSGCPWGYHYYEDR
jgi:hypothetical protein